MLIDYKKLNKLYFVILKYKKDDKDCREEILLENLMEGDEQVPSEIIMDMVNGFLRDRKFKNGTEVNCEMYWLGGKCSYLAFGEMDDVEKAKLIDNFSVNTEDKKPLMN